MRGTARCVVEVSRKRTDPLLKCLVHGLSALGGYLEVLNLPESLPSFKKYASMNEKELLF